MSLNFECFWLLIQYIMVTIFMWHVNDWEIWPFDSNTLTHYFADYLENYLKIFFSHSDSDLRIYFLNSFRAEGFFKR